LIHREKSRKRPERTPGELANNQSTAGVSPLGVIMTSGIFAKELQSGFAPRRATFLRVYAGI
jgi:hypothetical protein